MPRMRAVVIDMDSATNSGEIYTIVFQANGKGCVEKAVSWIDKQNNEDVSRGRYGLDITPAR